MIDRPADIAAPSRAGLNDATGGARSSIAALPWLALVATVVVIAWASTGWLPPAATADPALASGVRPAFQDVPAHPAVEHIVAFRGDMATAPENTLAAVTTAVQVGIPRVWVDVRQTSDGVPVLLADQTLDRTTDCTGEVAQRTAAEVTACDAGSWFSESFAGETVPRLADALMTPDVDWLIHLAAGDVQTLVDVVGRAGVADRTTVIVAHADALGSIRAGLPAVSTRLIARSPSDWPTATEAGADGFALDLTADDLTRSRDGESVRDAIRSGLDFTAFGVDAGVALREAEALGATQLASRRPVAAAWSVALTDRVLDRRDIERPPTASQGFMESVATGDFNGDGVMDLAVASTLDDEGEISAGWISVAMGGGSFPSDLQQSGGTEGDLRWGEVMVAGDFNDDGWDDLVIGTPRSDRNGNDAGGLWIWEGSPTGLRGQPRPFGPVSETNAALGASLAVGDFNGDGIDDLAAGAPGATVDRRSGAGRAYVLPGRAGAGPALAGALVFDRELEDVPGEPTADERVGDAVAVSDLNGDGLADLVVGAPEAAAGPERSAGSLLVGWSGGETVTETLVTSLVEEWSRADETISGNAERGGAFGRRLVGADFDGDGRGDLAVASPGASVRGVRGAGDIVVIFGGEDGPAWDRTTAVAPGTPLIPVEPAPRLGFGDVVSTGDLDGDGSPDLLIGLPDATRSRVVFAGMALAVPSGPQGLQPRRALGFFPDSWPVRTRLEGNLGYGASVAAGDFNGDGVPDMVIGAPGLDVAGVTDAGGLVMGWGWHPDLPSSIPSATTTVVASPTVATANPSPTGPTPTPTPPTPSPTSPTATPTQTPVPPPSVYMPYAARLHFTGRYGPSVPVPDVGRGRGDGRADPR